jgi:hypothetical protein
VTGSSRTPQAAEGLGSTRARERQENLALVMGWRRGMLRCGGGQRNRGFGLAMPGAAAARQMPVGPGVFDEREGRRGQEN